ncbi:hypothetical protein C1H46_045652 [Malus baccata]|uniref:Uncharacterized protein n=1 Tax=Malus baccata TaxID=106549 RepID=A0A540K3L1_MALBA|nr:hypothetical protein C1H46_045652 [Malus baccata]
MGHRPFWSLSGSAHAYMGPMQIISKLRNEISNQMSHALVPQEKRRNLIGLNKIWSRKMVQSS